MKRHTKTGKLFGDGRDSLAHDLRELLASYDSVAPEQALRPLDAFYLYRLLLWRNPHLTLEFPDLLANHQRYEDFLTALLASTEFKNTGGLLPGGQLFMAELDGFRFWFNTSDRKMGVRMALGLYEPRTVAFFKRILRPGMHCLDVGAQTGFFTCLMASAVGAEGTVHAFEPLPPSYELLCRNIQENHFEDRVRTYPMAASQSDSSIEMSRVSNMYVAGDVGGADKTTIACVRIDSVVQDHIDLIKIDIEGHEPAAIQGMRSLILRDQPILLTEVNEYWLRNGSRSSSAEYVNLLRSLGYELYRLDDLGNPLVPDLHLNPLDAVEIVALPDGLRWENI